MITITKAMQLKLQFMSQEQTISSCNNATVMRISRGLQISSMTQLTFRIWKKTYDRDGTRRFHWEEKDEYGVHRDDQGHARDTKLVPEFYTKDEISEMFYGVCGAQEKNEGDFQMKLDGLYYLLNDSISWLTTCMEEMRQDIAKIQTQLGKIARFRYVLKYDKFRLSYVNHEKVSIDNSIRTSIDTPFKISIDRTIAASIDASSRKLYGQALPWGYRSQDARILKQVSGSAGSLTKIGHASINQGLNGGCHQVLFTSFSPISKNSWESNLDDCRHQVPFEFFMLKSL
ncbi:hypothetical protein DY000_02007222 [Brassica cretica]|uniref:Uncharacterized protein n=1 Tax=Brassica cretica TaxID=69181 RepID=A0ABQ7C8G2_BRACR|nr:hypothetical protein DY000_02007222 [Brassica cretica]